MSIANICGRKEEKSVLRQAYESPEPEFIAVYGRRRVGKTHLIREFFGDSICFELIGIHDATLKEQLGNFAQALGKTIGIGVQPQRPSTWSEAFMQLEQVLDSPAKKKNKGKRVVFLDELPWLNTPRSNFLPGLEHFWNSWGSRQRNFILVICGSAASWMLQNIVRSRGGLHNRLTRQIRLIPFTLNETAEFLQFRRIELTHIQTVELYMTIGGIPHYLKQAEPGLSTAQIIDKACFSSQGLLREEFDKLFSSLFEESEIHIKIVKLLAKKQKGLTRGEILDMLEVQSGGSASSRLEELEQSGFIQSYIPFGKNANDALYRLYDEYSLFYLNWINKLGKRSPGQGYWLARQNSQRRKVWAGYAFENLCLKHVSRLKTSLGIANVETTETPWRYQSSVESEIPGAQIDLLIDRNDNTINICEMKFSDKEFTIEKKYADDLRRKLNVFKTITKTRKNVFLTMVTTCGVANNAYAKELVANSLTVEDLF